MENFVSFDVPAKERKEYSIQEIAFDGIRMIEALEPEISDVAIVNRRFDIEGHSIYDVRVFYESRGYRMELGLELKDRVYLNKIRIACLRNNKVVLFQFEKSWKLTDDDFTNAFFFTLTRAVLEAVQDDQKERWEKAKEALASISPNGEEVIENEEETPVLYNDGPDFDSGM